MSADRLIADALMLLTVVTALGVVRLRNLFAAAILLGIYSLLMALLWTDMQAYDVAFTEAAVGAGISTILVIGALLRLGGPERTSKEQHPPRVSWSALLVVAVVGGALIYGTLDMPRLGDAAAPVHVHPDVARYYIERSYLDTHVPNMVTSVLASYRGYDTMFETAVIFTAGLGMILLLRPVPGRPRPPRGEGPAEPPEDVAEPPAGAADGAASRSEHTGPASAPREGVEPAAPAVDAPEPAAGGAAASDAPAAEPDEAGPAEGEEERP